MRPLMMLALLAPTSAIGEDPPPLSKKTAEQMKSISASIKEVPYEITEEAGGFANSKLVATSVKFSPIPSAYAEKPVAAKIRWVSTLQQSKIYPTREKAEKATEWLKPGQVPGSPNTITSPVHYAATYYYVDGKWELDEIAWSTAAGGSSTKKDDTPWSKVLGKPK